MQDNNARTSFASKKSLLEGRKISQRYQTGSGERGPAVLDDVSLNLKENEIVGLLGRSGCGKSSLLRIVSGLVFPSGGEVSYLGQPVRGPVDGVAMGFQRFALSPWITALAHLQLRLRGDGVSELRAVPLDHRASQCRAWPAGKTDQQGRSPEARVESDRSHRPRRFRIRLS